MFVDGTFHHLCIIYLHSVHITSLVFLLVPGLLFSRRTGFSKKKYHPPMQIDYPSRICSARCLQKCHRPISHPLTRPAHIGFGPWIEILIWKRPRNQKGVNVHPFVGHVPLRSASLQLPRGNCISIPRQVQGFRTSTYCKFQPR